MKFSGYIPAIVSSVLVSTIASAVAAPKSVEQIRAIAQQVTARIESPADSGSGVIIAKTPSQKGYTYSVLTAYHVIAGIGVQESIEIVTADRQRHQITAKSVKAFPKDIDLAVLEFTSQQEYSVAKISTYPYRLYENREYDRTQSPQMYRSASEQNQHVVFVAGFPNAENTNQLVINPGFLVDTSASAISNPQARYQSYELLYSNMTHPGMSGGGVFDAQGRLIGIHGRSDGRQIDQNDQTVKPFLEEMSDGYRVRLGLSLGIPISTFLRLAPQYGVRLSLTEEKTAPGKIPMPSLASAWRPPNPLPPSNPFHWIERGNQEWRVGQFSQAQTSFDRAVAIRRDLSYGWFAKGFVYGFSRDYPNALSACTKAIEVHPSRNRYYDGWRCRSGALQYLKQFPAALEALNQAISIQSQLKQDAIADGTTPAVQNPSDLAARAEILFAMQQYQGALNALDQAIELRIEQQLPDSARLRNSRALILMVLKQNEAAILECDQALKLDPNYATAWMTRGMILSRMNQLPQALEAYEKAARLEPRNVTLWNNRGTLLFSMQQYEAALSAFEQALKLDPNYEPARRNHADLLQQMKR
ncbi:MAG: tetratricopeptide repeat-containing serine protease family protein [Leptolyngbya sp. Prado105]|jgi:tetratricopeptide (TPR) repeat protein|nr:tetratricopeptide repeat-containing serine protease family protein [Leptolyngbya sp. Prado105]